MRAKSEVANLREQLKTQTLYSSALKELLLPHMKREEIERRVPGKMRWLNLTHAVGAASRRSAPAACTVGTFRERAWALYAYLRGRAPELTGVEFPHASKMREQGK